MKKKNYEDDFFIAVFIVMAIFIYGFVAYTLVNDVSEPDFKIKIDKCVNETQKEIVTEIVEIVDCDYDYIEREDAMIMYSGRDEENKYPLWCIIEEFETWDYNKTEVEVCEQVEVKRSEDDLKYNAKLLESRICYDLCELKGINISDQKCFSSSMESFMGCGQRETFNDYEKWLDENCEPLECMTKDNKIYYEKYCSKNFGDDIYKYKCGEYQVEVIK